MQGLKNLGSTCAINSLIQIICRTTSLRNIFLNSNIAENTLSFELREIIDLMHNQKHSLSPNKFVSHLYHHMNGIFQIGEQIDIGELWMILFDKLSNEIAYDTNIVVVSDFELDKNINITDNNGLSLSEDLHVYCQQTIEKFNNHKTSAFIETNQGIILRITKCNYCNNTLYNFEPFISIELDIPDIGECPTIATMLRNYLKTQECSGDWKCDHCHCNGSYTKTLKLWKMPQVLVFIIKRFSNITQKNSKSVNVNTKLSIKKGSIICDMETEHNYICTSMALHHGSLFGGHYCALCNVDDKFIHYDDINISVVDDTSVDKIFQKNSAVYMVVYSVF